MCFLLALLLVGAYALLKFVFQKHIRNYDVVAVVERCENGTVYCTQRNRFFAGDKVEILAPSCKPVEMTLDTLWDENGEQIETANHAMMKFSFKCDVVFPSGTVIRKETE